MNNKRDRNFHIDLKYKYNDTKMKLMIEIYKVNEQNNC